MTEEDAGRRGGGRMNTDPRDWSRRVATARDDEQARPWHRPVVVISAAMAERARAAGIPEDAFTVDRAKLAVTA